MKRLLVIQSPTGLLKKEHIDGATDSQCFEVDDYHPAACQHFVDSWKGESCALFNEWFDGSEDNVRLPVCLEAERRGSKA